MKASIQNRIALVIDRLLTHAERVYAAPKHKGDDLEPLVEASVLKNHVYEPVIISPVGEMMAPATRPLVGIMMQRLLASGIADCVAFIGEGWAVNCRKDSPVVDVPPSEHPDRVECVMITVLTKEGRVMSVNPITMGEDGHKRLTRGEVRYDGIVKGRMFPPAEAA